MAVDPDKIKRIRDYNDALEKTKSSLTGLANLDERRRIANEQISNLEKLIAELKKDQYETGTKNEKLVRQLEEELKKINKQEDDLNKKLEKQVKYRQQAVDIGRGLLGQLKEMYKWMMESDKTIRSTNLQLGLSGNKAAMMRQSFEDSAALVTRLGGSLEDIATIQTTFADETGRAHVLTGDMVKNIELIGRGTGLGVEQAAKLGAQFQFMGFDAKSTMDYVQGVVDTSERMGVNTTKVLKVVSDNFKKLSTFTFQNGVASFAKMAQDAEKTRVSMETALNVAEATRGLENVIDLGAQLQVMGGNFAKMDPFQWLYLARNEPDKMMEKISEMTTGIYSLRKMSDGTFEKFISPADRDRLTQVAKSLGIAKEEMFEIAQRRFDIVATEKELSAMGLTDREKELVAGAAKMNKETGRFQVNLGGTMKDISELTKAQAQSFAKEQVLLKDRAEEALTFDEQLRNTINLLKAALLPMLDKFNKVMIPKIEKVAEKFMKFAEQKGGWLKIAGSLLAASLALKTAGSFIDAGVKRWVSGGLGNIMKKTGAGGGLLGGGGGGGVAAGMPGSDFTKTGMVRKGAAGLRQAKGMQALGTGAGAGAAMAGAGAGIMLAAKGLSELADSMSKLTPEQAESLQKIATTLAITFPLAAIGIALVAAVAAPAAVPLLALGAALLMMGGAIGIATAGIGFMAQGFGKMFEAAKGAGAEMPALVGGMTGLVAALGAATITLPTAIGMAMVLKRMAKSAPQLAIVGESLKNIKEGLSGNAGDYERIAKAVNTISKAKLKKDSTIGALADMLNKPLRVEFDRERVNLENNITLNLDGEKFMRKAYNVELAVQAREDRRNNK